MEFERTQQLLLKAMIAAKYNNDASFFKQLRSMAERYIYFSDNREAQGDRLNEEL